MKKNYLFYSVFALTFVLGSCSDEMFDNTGQVNKSFPQNTRAITDANWTKAYVLCEGTWKKDPPSLPGKLITYDNNWKKIGKEIEIGDTGNDLIQYGSKLYCAVSGHDLTYGNGGIWIFNAATGAPYGGMRQYDDEKSHSKAMPRHLAAYGGMIYVSLYSGAVMAIDTTEFEKKMFTKLDATYSEGICVANNTVYVCNSGNTGDSYAGQGTTISKLTTDLKIVEPITVPTNPKLIAQAPNGTLYFNSLGNYTTEKSALYKLEGEGYSHVANLADAFQIGDNAIFTTYVKWHDPNYEMPTTLQKVSFSGDVTPFTTSELPDLMLGYSISVNPFNGDVCFGQSGQNLYVYRSDGTPIRANAPIETGTANPNRIVFVQ